MFFKKSARDFILPLEVQYRLSVHEINIYSLHDTFNLYGQYEQFFGTIYRIKDQSIWTKADGLHTIWTIQKFMDLVVDNIGYYTITQTFREIASHEPNQIFEGL